VNELARKGVHARLTGLCMGHPEEELKAVPTAGA